MEAKFKRYRQVAIVVSSLDRDTADTLLAQMPEEEATAVRRTILSLDEITDEEQAAALTEFMRRGGKSSEVSAPSTSVQRGTLDSGVELDIDPAKLRAAAPRNVPAFECLQGIDGAWLAPRISPEHPQTIAVVVSHLSQVEAAKLLGALPPAQQTDVIRRLADLDEMDVDSLREIESHLKSWLTENYRDRQRRTMGVSNVAAILRAADPLTRSRLVKQLRLSDQELAEQLKENATTLMSNNTTQLNVVLPATFPTDGPDSIHTAKPLTQPVASGTGNVAHFGHASLGNQAYSNPALTAFVPPVEAASAPHEIRHTETVGTPALVPQSFDELATWTDRALRTLLRECEPELILLALTGAGERVVRRVLEMFPARQAATLKHALKHPGPTRLSDVAAAQQEIVQLAMELILAGKLPAQKGQLSVAA